MVKSIAFILHFYSREVSREFRNGHLLHQLKLHGWNPGTHPLKIPGESNQRLEFFTKNVAKWCLERKVWQVEIHLFDGTNGSIIPLGISYIKSRSLGSKKPIVLYRGYPPLWGHRGWENDSVQPISGAISNLGVLKMYLSSFVWHDIVLLGVHWFIQMPWPRQFSKNKLGSLILFSKWLLTKKVTKSWFCTGTTWGEMDENLVITCLWYINLKLPSNEVVVSLLTDCHLKGSRIYTPWLLFEAASLDF